MKACHTISITTVVLLVAFTASASALEPKSNLRRAVHPESGSPQTRVPRDPSEHATGGVRSRSNTCPATNVGVLTDGSAIVGGTIGSTDDFVAGCGSLTGGRDEIFEFSVDFCGVWTFDSCTVPAGWDTTLEIREETGGGCPGDFVACDGDGCNVGVYESAVSAFLIPTSTYYLIVDGWSSFAYGSFTITATLTTACCLSDADCDDGIFCNGQEICDAVSGECQGGTNPCTTFEGYSAPCDEATDSCTKPDPCFTWIAGDSSGSFFPQANNCPNLASWVFDDVQVSHHTTGLLDFYTTPILARSTPAGASPLGANFLVNQALFTVEPGSCNPLAEIAGSQCTGLATVDPGGAPAHDLPCSGTMPLLPNNVGDFTVCEIDFFMAYRTSENGAGMDIAGQKPLLGGPAAADEFGLSVIWVEDCPPSGVYGATFFGDDLNFPADFATAVVCQKPQVACCAPDGTCLLVSAADCAAIGGTAQMTGTINGPATCAGVECVGPSFVPAGADCWKSAECGGNTYNFSDTPIPAGFFDISDNPPSLEYSGSILLEGASPDGVPDTQMARLADMDFSGLNLPTTLQTPIELVALDLISCDPIIVEYCCGGPPTFWDVEVTLSPKGAPSGNMAVTKTHDNGGTFTSVFNLQMLLTFTNVDDQADIRFFDTGAAGFPPLTLAGTAAEWVHDPGGNVEVCGENFAPGYQGCEECVGRGPLPACCILVGHSSGTPGHVHQTGPPDCSPCPGACCDPTDSSCTYVTEADCNAVPGDFKGIRSNCDDSDCDGLAGAVENNDCCAPRDACNTGTDPNNPDTDGDGLLDGAEITGGTDACDPCDPDPLSPTCDRRYGSDCNGNGILDKCDIAAGTSADCNNNGIPDECEPDCDNDGCADACQILCGAPDDNNNTVPDKCEDTKFSQPPEGEGEDIASNIDWVDEIPNVVVADDFVSDGRAITGIRWWGSDISKPLLECVPPGQDEWTTYCGGTRYDFNKTPIPADFFEPGSALFTGLVQLQGASGGSASDTFVFRKEEMCFVGPLPVTDQTEIFLKALDLIGCQSITVFVNGQATLWDLTVFLDGPQKQGTLTATMLDTAGGTFNTVLVVQAGFRFTKVAGPGIPIGSVVELLPGVQQTLTSTEIPWWKKAPWGGGCTGFCPGGYDPSCCPVPCCPNNCHSSFGLAPHDHCVTPRGCEPCAKECGDGNVDPGEECDPPGSPCPNGGTCQFDCTCPLCCLPFEGCFAADLADCVDADGFPVSDCQQCPPSRVGGRVGNDDSAGASLVPRREVIKPAHTQVDDARFRTDVICVKFRDGLLVRLRSGGLTDMGTGALGGSEDVLDSVAAGRWERTHSLPEAKLDQLRQTAQENLRKVVADLNLQFNLFLPDGADTAETIDAFNTLDSVEIAVPVPHLIPAPLQPQDYEPNQRYLDAASDGVDAECMWMLPGGTGAGVKIADIEYSWNLSHQDLPPVTLLGAQNVDPFNDDNHGTAVLGEIGSLRNGVGTTGIAYGSSLFVVAACTAAPCTAASVANAITTAIGVADNAFQPRDVILLEQQTAGPNYTGIPAGTQFGLVPVEWFQPTYNAIMTAVGNGVIVVEAGANGSQNLDAPEYNVGHAPFLPVNDSGAIIVGAGAPPGHANGDRSRLGFSNYGSTVDLQGWGANVYTTGYGYLYPGGTPQNPPTTLKNEWYTSTFGGTSSASPIVAGTCAILQGAHLANAGITLTPGQVLAFLQATGSPQLAGIFPATQNIGPRPNASAAISLAFPALDTNSNLIPDACEAACPVPICGDNTVNQPNEECDGTSDAACPGVCRVDCTCPPRPDGWFISFHEPLVVGAPPLPPLGLYFCDVLVVNETDTTIPACDAHPVIDYSVDLADCCLVHANPDSRSGEIPAVKDAFFESQCFDYAIDIQAVIGHRFVQHEETFECIEIPTGHTTLRDFWGWHTTDFQCGIGGSPVLQPALTTSVTMAGPDWLYGPWSPVIPVCSSPNMAFELITREPPSGIDANNNCIPDKCEECRYDNGPPLDDFGAPASQYAPDFPFAAGAADDFILPGMTGNPCRITRIRTWTTHFNFLIPPNPPTDYDGVNVTIYANATPKGPGGRPEDDGTHSESFPGGIVTTFFVPMSSITAFPFAAPCISNSWQLEIPVDIKLDKNVKYWLEIQPVWIFGDGGETLPGGQVAILLSLENHDHPAQQIFPAAGINDWTEITGNVGSDGPCNLLPPGSLRDLAFELFVEKVVPGACCFESQGYPACVEVIENDCVGVLGGIFQGTGSTCPTERVTTASHVSGPFSHLTDPAQQCPAGFPRSGCTEGDPIDPWRSPLDGIMCHQFGVGPESPAIPADFFGPGSDPFTGEVCLEGVPLGATAFGVFGEADTLVKRTGGPSGNGDPFDRCDLPSGTGVNVDVEIVALSLKSTDPITVTFNGGQNPEQWDVVVELSDTITPPRGTITAVKTHCNGGTYGSSINVQPKFTFTEVANPGNFGVLDTGAEGIPHVTLVQSADTPWTSEVSDNFGLVSTICTDFHPGIEDPEITTACDCNANNINDTCDTDCQPNGVPDDCDIASGTSQDLDGNGVPDECIISTPVLAGPPDKFLKNRYISIDPRGEDGLNFGRVFDIKVTLTSTLVNGQQGNGPWWAGPPDANCLSVVQTVSGGPTNWDACPTLHLTGCPIIPTSVYDIVAVLGGTDSVPPLAASTQAKPGIKWHGDCVGSFTGTEWTGPNGQVNIDDAVAAIKTFQNPSDLPGCGTPPCNATHTSVTDVAPNLTAPPSQINKIVNIEDVLIIILGFQGGEYPGKDLTRCP